jgi:hypothetical protein
MGSMDNLPITYLSFWDVELNNLPAGLFSKRVLSTAEARGILNAARSSDTLVGVSREDLAAPYGARARQRHEELCAVLCGHANIEVHLRDFFGEDCVNPSCVAEVTGQSRLLVVDCNYKLDHLGSGCSDRPEPDADAADCRDGNDLLKMKLAPDSLQFHLFEQISDSTLMSPGLVSVA